MNSGENRDRSLTAVKKHLLIKHHLNHRPFTHPSSNFSESTSKQPDKTPQAWNRIILLPIMTFGIGWISAYLGSRLAFFFVVQGLESLL